MSPLFVILGVVGPTEFILIIAVVLLLFGGKKIPELMKGVGSGMREFKKASQGDYDKEEVNKPASGSNNQQIEKN
jgi:sec-independent protein translocase protein TatA